MSLLLIVSWLFLKLFHPRQVVDFPGAPWIRERWDALLEPKEIIRVIFCFDQAQPAVAVNESRSSCRNGIDRIIAFLKTLDGPTNADLQCLTTPK